MAAVDPPSCVRTVELPVRQMVGKPVRRLREVMRPGRVLAGERPSRWGTAGGLFGRTGLAVGGQALAVLVTAGLALVVPAWASVLLVAAGLASVGFALGAGRTQGAGRDRSDGDRSSRGRLSRGVRADGAEIFERNRG